MRISVGKWILRGAAALLGICLAGGAAAAATAPHYLITNDDRTGNFFANSLTFYTIESDGSLTLKQQVLIGVTGMPGGYFPANRVVALNASGNQCVFASDAATGEIDGVDVNTLTLVGHANGSSGDTGLSNGIGLALSPQYLYASFTDSSTIGAFQIEPSCGLSFIGDVTVGGLQGGIIDGMAVHGNLLVATYGDGSIESFNLTSGMPVSNGDQQNSTGSRGGGSYPSAVDITRDGRFAIFGDTSTSTMIEVSNISSGKLSKTTVYQSAKSVSSSNIMLSPDETLLYISNTQGDRVTAVFFDHGSGKLFNGCESNLLKGYSSAWSYLAGLGFASDTGNGHGVYVAEFGSPSSIAEVRVKASNGECSLAEVSGSPVEDPNSPGLLSIATFPPRSF
jgi:6-phosphogluconolactonase (cycloisomerase 2 family)